LVEFKLRSSFKVTQDQSKVIFSLYKNILRGVKHQVLSGVTGSGKTFTIANLISKLKLPTIIISHNKVLAYQLYSNFKYFFPQDVVCFYVSHYNYYQPESFSPTSNIYLQKEASINKKLEEYNFNTLNNLLNNRRNIIIISSVSCIYNINNPDNIKKSILCLFIHQTLDRSILFKKLINIFYIRSFNYKKILKSYFVYHLNYFIIHPVNENFIVKIIYIGNLIQNIQMLDVKTLTFIKNIHYVKIFPAKHYLIIPDDIHSIISNIQLDLDKQIDYFISKGKNIEADRLKQRVMLDIDMIINTGTCIGIENYSTYFQNRHFNRPFCLLDFFNKNYLMVIDESHVTLPQIKAMFLADVSRKKHLIKYGYRLPSALENRPINFKEFEKLQDIVIYMSATPSKYEISKSNNNIIHQFIRPTGILDPIIELRCVNNEILDLVLEIKYRLIHHDKIIINTLTKNISEELSKYLLNQGIYNGYIHSSIDTVTRVNVINNFKAGLFHVIVGVNMLREGLDFLKRL
jgi:excinuclease ABC subunit B